MYICCNTVKPVEKVKTIYVYILRNTDEIKMQTNRLKYKNDKQQQ